MNIQEGATVTSQGHLKLRDDSCILVWVILESIFAEVLMA